MENNNKKRGRKKGQKYFTELQEEAVVKYQQLPSGREKEKLFECVLYPSLVQIVDNLVKVYNLNGITCIDEVKNDCVSFLCESLPVFDPSLGYKAFSFLSVIAKNWLLQYSKKYNKKKNIFISESESVFETKEEEKKSCFDFEEQEFEALLKEFTGVMEKNIRKNTSLYKVFLGFCVFLNSYKNYSVSSYNRKAMIDFISNYTKMDKKRVSVSLYRLKKNYKIYKEKKNNI
ncbi:MAG: hypothetical protein N3A54_03005 [Patescibacteria group bacterium]|nr:hypothetical protein [Patescibacteria group bacterium]